MAHLAEGKAASAQADDEATARADPTFPAEGRDGGRVSFLLGSCRYPGLLWKPATRTASS